MFMNLNHQIGRGLFRRSCHGVLDVPPVRLAQGNDVLLLSQLQHKDVLMYLVAAKSFCSRVPVGNVTVLDDGSLQADDKALLADHIPGVTVEPITAHRSNHCPHGGTWERLLAITAHTQQHYVVQLDADTVTIGPLDEINACAARGTSFALGTWDSQRVEPMGFRAAQAREHNPLPEGHVQVVAEKAFDRVAGFQNLRYVRGCSGFAGFARGSVTRSFVEDFSRQMQGLIGARWNEWGSEQVMSNVAVANSPAVDVLPHPRYCDCNHISPESVFIHFIGDCRFRGSIYRRTAGAQVRRLGPAA